jgi:hypothetical protein
MKRASKYRVFIFGGVLLPMSLICIFRFLIGPTLVGERQAAEIGSTLGFWFVVYLAVVVAIVVAREVRAKKQK